MKRYKNKIVIGVCILISVNMVLLFSRQRGSVARKKPVISQKKLPVVKPHEYTKLQESITHPTSYAQALSIIRTQMPSNHIIRNNTFAPEFITFVQSLNLNPKLTQALLEAGSNLHMQLSDQSNHQNILKSFDKSIQIIIQAQSKTPTDITAHKLILKQPIRDNKPTLSQKPISSVSFIKQSEDIPQPVVRVENHPTTNNVAILLDPNKNESVEKDNLAFTMTALTILFEKAAPIIMTSNILENIIKINQIIGEQNLHILRNTPLQQMISQARNMALLSKNSLITPLLLICLSKIDFNNINYYFHTSENLVLLIPKDYIQANAPKAVSFNLNDQAITLGFNPILLTAISNISLDSLTQYIQKQKLLSIDSEKFIYNLSALFIHQKKYTELISPEHDTKWLIYLGGHGSHPYLSIGSTKELLDINKKNLAFAKKSATKDDKFQKIVSESESNIKRYENMLQGREAWPDSQIIPESAQIAGISPNNFSQLMAFFDKKINTAYIHYTTCFSGGINQTFVNETLLSLNVNFIVSTEGMDERMVFSGSGLQFISSTQQLILTGISFFEFFTRLRTFFTQPEEYIKTKERQTDPIIKIIKTISNEDINQKPFVRFPATTFFTTPRSKRTFVITRTMIKAHEIEKKAIEIIDPNIDTVIISSSRINVPINFGRKRQNHIALALPSPKKNIVDYEAIHVLKEIEFQDSLQSFIFSCVSINARLYTQTLIVNTLKGILYIESGLPASQKNITNFIIQMKGVSISNEYSLQAPVQPTALIAQKFGSGRVGINVQIAFELDNTIYKGTFAINKFEDLDDIYKNLQGLTFSATPKHSTNMSILASNFLTPEEINKLPKPITLEAIAEYINTKIDKQDPSMALQDEANTEALFKFTRRIPK